MRHAAVRVWPLLVGSGLCWFVWFSRESLRYGWIPARLFWMAAGIGVVAWMIRASRRRGTDALLGYLAVLFGAVLFCGLTQAMREALAGSLFGDRLTSRFGNALSLLLVLTPCFAPAVLAAIEGVRDRSPARLRLVVGIAVGAIAGIWYDPWFAVGLLEVYGLRKGNPAIPHYTGFGGRLGVADIQLFVAIAAASGAYAVRGAPGRQREEASAP